MCCGRDNNQALGVPTQVYTPAQGAPGARPSPGTAEAQFEYTGKTALTVVSPLTRLTYRFPQPGARVSVNPRDRSWMAFVPHLRRSG
jgi:hypothetical protein